jgi:hypothetical protein
VLIPDETTGRDSRGQRRAAMLVLKDESASYQLVGGVRAYQG